MMVGHVGHVGNLGHVGHVGHLLITTPFCVCCIQKPRQPCEGVHLYQSWPRKKPHNVAKVANMANMTTFRVGGQA